MDFLNGQIFLRLGIFNTFGLQTIRAFLLLHWHTLIFFHFGLWRLIVSFNCVELEMRCRFSDGLDLYQVNWNFFFFAIATIKARVWRVLWQVQLILPFVLVLVFRSLLQIHFFVSLTLYFFCALVLMVPGRMIAHKLDHQWRFLIGIFGFNFRFTC